MKKNYKLIILVLSVLLIVGVICVLRDNIFNKKYTYNIKLNINKVDDSFGLGRIKMNDDVSEVYGVFISKYKFLNDLKIPDDLNIKSTRAIYVRSEIKKYANTDFNKKYDTLNNYTNFYHNEKDSRHIQLKFSDKYIPLRDYSFDGTTKMSIINGTKLKIFEYQDLNSKSNMYLAVFTYNNINFDIETMDITESELVELLKSIIK